MDSSIPRPAARILDFIGEKEAPNGYDTVYGNNQRKLTKPITQMTVDELIANQSGFTKNFGSSASGRYQFMRATLQDLKKTENLSGREIFTPDLQDRLGYALLKRRGYTQWVNGTINHDSFMIGLAKEWASFPVPFDMQGAHRKVKRGETYYAGDKLNKSLVDAGTVWNTLVAAHRLKDEPIQVAEPEPVDTPSVIVTPTPERKLLDAIFALLSAFFKKEA